MKPWLQECADAASALTPLQGQSILDCVNNGETLGDVASAHGVTLEAVCGVVDLSIMSVSLLRKDFRPTKGETDDR